MFEMTFAAIARIVDAAPLISQAQCKWVSGQIQSSMIFEALRKEPNPIIISSMNVLLEKMKDVNPIPAWESVIDNLPQFRKDTELQKAGGVELEAALYAEAEEECIRRATAGFAPLPKNPNEAHKAVKAMMLNLAEKKAEERNRFTEAVEYVLECCSTRIPQAVLDEVEIPENILGNIYNSFYSELEKLVLKRIQLERRVRLNPWQEQQLRTLQASCKTLAGLLGVTTDKVEQALLKTEDIARAAFKTATVLDKSATDEPEKEEVTIDNAPKTKRRRVQETVDNVASRMGVSSKEMAQAAGVK